MKIIYAPSGGIVVSDFDAKQTAIDIVRMGRDVVVSTFEIIEWVQLIVAYNPEISSTVEIAFQEHKITIDELGQFSSWPNGFGDRTQRRFADLIQIRRKEPNYQPAYPELKIQETFLNFYNKQ